jgi:hypothetical protein
MPRFLIERPLGDISMEELERAADHSTQVRLEKFPGMEHEHTHVVHDDGGFTAFCVYRADGPDTVREHAQASNLPVERILEIEKDLEPPPT